MRKLTTLIALCALVPLASGQDKNNANIGVETSATGKVTISSKGREVRDVLYDLFTQSKKSFVIESETKGNLYLSLTDVPFEQALTIVLKQTDLCCWMDGDIAYIRKASSMSAGLDANTNPQRVFESKKPKATETPQKPKAADKPKVTKAPALDLDKPITVNLTKVGLREVMKELSKQTDIEIVVAKDVKDYKLDAHLEGKTLRYALELITKSAKLQFGTTDYGAVLVEHKVN
ncbi:MAG: hypothetical protein JSS65_04560 [Armatimonadetes bacterium]|nr:hypothetical protein [Armatimonadota bacterium]